MVLAAGLAFSAWRCHSDRAPRLKRASTTARVRRIKLDLQKLRMQRRVLVERIETLRKEREIRRAQLGEGTPRSTKTPRYGPVASMLSPCWFGPAALCEMVAELVLDCEEGDARACLATAQLLLDQPPHDAAAAMMFFQLACKHGDQEGCARTQEARFGTKPCADDLLACGVRAIRTEDVALQDEACSLGVAVACAHAMENADREDDEELGRAYLEQACQLGDPLMCKELGRRLRPGCEPEEQWPCYAPDAEEAAAATAMACEAGWGETCE